MSVGCGHLQAVCSLTREDGLGERENLSAVLYYRKRKPIIAVLEQEWEEAGYEGI